MRRGATERRGAWWVFLLLYVVAGYHAVAFSAWQIRNPKANSWTVWTHYLDAVTWEKLEKFQ